MRHLDEENNAAKDMFVTEGDDYNMLRPETVESLMILYRATGDEIYREHGRRILQAIETYSKVTVSRALDPNRERLLLTRCVCLI